MDQFLIAQTSYIESIQTVAQLDEAVGYMIIHIVLTRLGTKKGIKTFKEAGICSIYKEMK